MNRVSIVAALASLILLTAPLAQCALAWDRDDGARVIRLVERAQDFAVQDLDPARAESRRSAGLHEQPLR